MFQVHPKPESGIRACRWLYVNPNLSINSQWYISACWARKRVLKAQVTLGMYPVKHKFTKLRGKHELKQTLWNINGHQKLCLSDAFDSVAFNGYLSCDFSHTAFKMMQLCWMMSTGTKSNYEFQPVILFTGYTEVKHKDL